MKFKKILYLLVLSVLLFGINSNCFAVDSAEVELRITGSIFKTNDRGDGLLGAKFKVHDLNNTFSYYAEDEQNGLYGLGYFSTNSEGPRDVVNKKITSEAVFAMFPRKVQSDIDTYLETGSSNHLDSNYYMIMDNAVYFNIPLFIEEETAPSGYVIGEKIVIPLDVEVKYHPDYSEIYLDAEVEQIYLKYNKNLDYNDFSSYLIGERFSNDLVDCNQLDFHSNVLDNTGIDYDPIILFNEKGNVVLKINNYVNNLEKFTTTRGKTLNYRVEVVNSGTVSSTNNVIVTQVPKELVYVKGSASDGGIYNKTNHTITWKISKIVSNSKVSFRYSATVPKNVLTGISFIGKSSITSQEIGEIQSRKTNVSLINNPDTAAPIAVVVILASMLGIMTVIKNHRKEQEMN